MDPVMEKVALQLGEFFIANATLEDQLRRKDAEIMRLKQEAEEKAKPEDGAQGNAQ